MTEEEKEYYSNLGWLGAIARSPKNVLKVNDFAIDRLKKLGYIDMVGSFVVITEKGKAYLHSIVKE